MDGTKNIRVHTFNYPISHDLNLLLQTADFDTLALNVIQTSANMAKKQEY